MAKSAPTLSAHTERPDYPELTDAILQDALRQACEEAGENLTQQRDVFVRLRKLEPTIYNAPRKLLDPDPNQPRQRFNDETIGELAVSLQSEGQTTPMVAAPYLNGEGALRLRLIGGGRRTKAFDILEATHADVRIVDGKSPLALFVAQWLDNFHEELNDVDEGRSVKRMITLFMEEGGMGEGEAKAKVGEITGYSEAKINNYLKLVELMDQYPELEEEVLTNGIPPLNMLNLTRSTKKGKMTDADREKHEKTKRVAVRMVLDAIRSDKPVTANAVQDIREGAIAEVHGEEFAMVREATRLIEQIRSGFINATSKMAELTRLDRASVIQAILDLPKPPEVLRGFSEEAIAAAIQLHHFTEDALEPDVPESDENTSFAEYIEEIEFGHDVRRSMALEIAKAADEDDDISGGELSRKIGVNEQTLLSHLPLLKSELSNGGIVVTKHTRNARGQRGKLRPIVFYRMLWEGQAEQDGSAKVLGTDRAVGFQVEVEHEELEAVAKDIARMLIHNYHQRLKLRAGTGNNLLVKITEAGHRRFKVACNMQDFKINVAPYAIQFAAMIRDALSLPKADVQLFDILK